MATANNPTHVLVKIRDSSSRPCPVQQNISAKLELIPQATPINQPLTTSTSAGWPKKVPEKCVATPSQYKVSYTAVSRGPHKLHIQVNDKEISDSPFTMTVYPDPTQLHYPVREVTDLQYPYGIAYNSRREIIVSEWGADRVLIIDNETQKRRSCGHSRDKLISPTGIAIDNMDNIYVSSWHKLQKFTSNGELIACVGKKGRKEREFDVPRGVTLHNNQVYVCDCNNHRIQVFDLKLNFIRSIGSIGKGKSKFKEPYDVKLDTAGNIFVAEYSKSRVQVLDNSGLFIQTLGDEGEGKLNTPSGLHIVADKHLYISDRESNYIVVYETSGQYITSFGMRGKDEGEFSHPFCITSCVDGFIHVCDWGNKRVQIF